MKRENKKSAGILLYRTRKGGVEEGEDMLETAKREFAEETGNSVDFNDDYIELTPVKLKSGKKIHAFAFKKDIEFLEIKSNLFEMEFPTGSGLIKSFPEVDKGGWFNKQKCEELLNKKQYNFVIELENKIVMVKTERPWGYYEILLDSEFTKVKKITVKPGGKLSLQYHKFRNEHWVIVSGTGAVTMENSVFSTKPNDHFYIASNIKHRIENSGNEDLIFIETQTGSYFGEDDIIRLEDFYNR